MVYILNKNKQPLMPTHRHGKVRRLLKEGKAIVVKRTPFTIQLLYETTFYVESLVLGVDSGSKVIGLSVSSESKEYYASEVELRTDIVDLLSTKRQNRRTRRNRLRYRKPRFNNRTRSKHKGWLAPSIEHKIQTHLKVVEDIKKILPISKIIVETASFDIQKLKNPDISGVDYQQGEQVDSWNVREYVFFRDKHTCQHCRGKTKDKRLNTHHIESRKTGGDTPSNLITLCKTCHGLFHQGKFELKIKRGLSYRDATFMGIMRWTFYNRLKEKYNDIPILNTYGYITKNTRINNQLEKNHAVDALCIAGHPQALPLKTIYLQKKLRCHNRQIHKANILKGGKKKNNQTDYQVKGFRLFDKATYRGDVCFITGRRATGYFVIKDVEGNILHKSVSFKKLKFIETRKSYITHMKRREAIPLITYAIA